MASSTTSLPAGVALLAEKLHCQISSRFSLGPLSFAIPEASAFAIVGPDGSGKSSLIQILAALRQADGGKLLGCGATTPPASRRSIGYVSQHFSLYHDLTVHENLLFIGELFSVPAVGAAIDALLAFTGLHPFTGRPAGMLSGGMKQKLSLAAALLHEPAVVLLDEPTTGLDPVARSELWALLQSLVTQGTTVVYATSVLEEAEHSHTMMMMHQGSCLAMGSPSTLKEASGLKHTILQVSEPRLLLTTLRERESSLLLNLQNNGIALAAPREWESSRLQLYGIAEQAIDWSPPTCEELFLYLISQSNQELSSHE